jgi:hypothetical protein
MQVKLIRHCLQCWLFPVFLAFSDQQSGSARPKIDLMRADLGLIKDWDSTRIQVGGLYLGMPRNEAGSAIRKTGFRLVQDTLQKWSPCSDYSECFVADTDRDVYQGVSIAFSEGGIIIKIAIEVDLETRSDLLNRFKGETHRFFNDAYSDELRLKLLGHETSLKTVSGRYGEKLKDTEYIYSQRGVTITVSPRVSVTSDATGRQGLELTHVSFVLPERPPR